MNTKQNNLVKEEDFKNISLIDMKTNKGLDKIAKNPLIKTRGNKMQNSMKLGNHPFARTNKEVEGRKNNQQTTDHLVTEDKQEEEEEETKIVTEVDKCQTTETTKKTLQKDKENDLSRIPVGGRLFRFRATWRGAAHESIISKGLSWSWVRNPPPPETLQQRTSYKMEERIKKLYRWKVIEKAKTIKWQSRLFMVPKKDSIEDRLIVDLSALNKFIACPKFKMLTMNQIRLLLPKTFWTASLDLKDGYWHVPVTPKKRPYLGFRYKNQNWQFRALPFGLNVGPRIFTKLIAHIVKVMAARGIWCLPFLNNLLIISSTEEECIQHTEMAITILKAFG